MIKMIYILDTILNIKLHPDAKLTSMIGSTPSRSIQWVGYNLVGNQLEISSAQYEEGISCNHT